MPARPLRRIENGLSDEQVLFLSYIFSYIFPTGFMAADPRERSRGLAEPSKQTPRQSDWQFTTENARIKLKRLYPQFE